MLRSNSNFSFSAYIRPWVIYADNSSLKRIAACFMELDVRFYFYSEEYIITADDPTESLKETGCQYTLCHESWVEGICDDFLGFKMSEKSAHFNYFFAGNEKEQVRITAENIHVNEDC